MKNLIVLAFMIIISSCSLTEKEKVRAWHRGYADGTHGTCIYMINVGDSTRDEAYCNKLYREAANMEIE